jgi:ferrochelatase
MRYWRPFIGEAVRALYEKGAKEIVALSLYPQYSIATTGSSLAAFDEAVAGLPVTTRRVTAWFDHPGYISALAEAVSEGLARFGGEPAEILFSAHSLPKSIIDAGDPYVKHIEATVRAVSEKLGLNWHLSYQSKSGPVEWLSPSTEDMLAELARKGAVNVLIVPVSFVSDHIETLYEIDILYGGEAKKLGLRLVRAESLNTRPRFIEALRALALQALRDTDYTPG